MIIEFKANYSQGVPISGATGGATSDGNAVTDTNTYFIEKMTATVVKEGDCIMLGAGGKGLKAVCNKANYFKILGVATKVISNGVYYRNTGIIVYATSNFVAGNAVYCRNTNADVINVNQNYIGANAVGEEDLVIQVGTAISSNAIMLNIKKWIL